MYQNYSQFKLYLEALINDHDEMQDIFKTRPTLKNILSMFFFVSLKKFFTEYGK